MHGNGQTLDFLHWLGYPSEMESCPCYPDRNMSRTWQESMFPYSRDQNNSRHFLSLLGPAKFHRLQMSLTRLLGGSLDNLWLVRHITFQWILADTYKKNSACQIVPRARKVLDFCKDFQHNILRLHLRPLTKTSKIWLLWL